MNLGVTGSRNTITAEEFLKLCEPNDYYSNEKPGTRRNRVRRMYNAYRAAYTAPTLEKLCLIADQPNFSDRKAILQAAKDRDAGRPLIEIPELMEERG